MMYVNHAEYCRTPFATGALSSDAQVVRICGLQYQPVVRPNHAKALSTFAFSTG